MRFRNDPQQRGWPSEQQSAQQPAKKAVAAAEPCACGCGKLVSAEQPWARTADGLLAGGACRTAYLKKRWARWRQLWKNVFPDELDMQPGAAD